VRWISSRWWSTTAPPSPITAMTFRPAILYLGELLMSMAKPAEAEGEFRVAVAGYRKLVEDNPDNVVFRTYLARSHDGLAGCCVSRAVGTRRWSRTDGPWSSASG